jgi:hypothetical protein
VDTTTIIIIVGVIALVALYLFRRSRPAPRGTYDDKNVRSSGSIGGGTRAYDDPNTRSSGSIGGRDRGYDSPDHESGGSIGAANRERRLDRDELDDERGDERSARGERTRRTPRTEEPKHDDDRFKSGGSFGA